MLKTAALSETKDLESEFEAFLRGLVRKIPFLKLQSLRKEAHVGPSPSHVDWLAKVRAGDHLWTLAVEAKKIAQPRQVRDVVLQLEHYMSHLPADGQHYGLLLAPFISEQSARICKEAGIGYADLAGNALISFDNVFIETRSADNPFRERRDVKSLFAPRACRVLRVLLQGPLRSWRVAELADKSQVSLGWVSAVRQQLIAREWAIEERQGFRVSKPDQVLEAWVAADQWNFRTTVRQYSLLLTDPNEIAKGLRNFLGDKQHAFTQWFAGWLRHPYTLPPAVTAYVAEFPEETAVEKTLLARHVEQGGRLWLVRPRDEGIFWPMQSVSGFTLVSDVQIYLDLRGAGQRGDEQAEELRKWPDFAGGWSG